MSTYTCIIYVAVQLNSSVLISNLQGKCLHLEEQFDLFEKTVNSELPSHFNSPEKLADYLSKSILAISIGSNDYLNNYLETKLFNTSQRFAPEPFAQLLVDSLSRQLQVHSSSLNTPNYISSFDSQLVVLKWEFQTHAIY